MSESAPGLGKNAGAPDLSDVAEKQFATLRERLVERRVELGMTMSELARQIGVSPSMVSQIERGLTLPSVGTLFALATALGASVDTFFSDPEAAAGGATRAAPVGADGVPALLPPASRDAGDGMYVVRRADRPAITISGGVRWERLTPVSVEPLEFLELVYAPGAESGPDLYRHSGLEMVLVLEGVFVIHIGFERYELHPGDSMVFPSWLPHRYVNPTDREARAVTAILRDDLAESAHQLASQFRERGDASPKSGVARAASAIMRDGVGDSLHPRVAAVSDSDAGSPTK